MSSALSSYEISGDLSAGVPLVLLRPIGGSLALWGRFRELVSARRPVIACDRRGIGRSPRRDRSTSTRAMARDVALVLEHIGARAYDVLGLSLGGMVASWLAIERGDLVRRLVLASTPARGASLASLSGRSAKFAACMLLPSGDREACLTRHALSGEYRREQPERTREILDAVRAERGSLRTLVLDGVAGARHDVRHELTRITCPTLCMAGELDPLVGPRGVRELAARIRDAAVEIVPRVGHDLSFECPDALAEVVDRFLG